MRRITGLFGNLEWMVALIDQAGNEAAAELVASLRHEEELYRRYKEFYGYVFYIAKKTEQ